MNEFYPISEFYETIERKIKNEIDFMFFSNNWKEFQCDKPTVEEYSKFFEMARQNIKCEVSNYDLGIYE